MSLEDAIKQPIPSTPAEAERGPLDYYSPPVPSGCLKFSPSSVGKFLNNPAAWYRSTVLKEKDFDGNTSTYLGTVVHYAGEMTVLGQPIDENEIEKYIKKAWLNVDVDGDAIRAEWREMADALINEYILPNKPDTVEEYIEYQVSDNFYVGGSCDAVRGETLIDYKTKGTKPSGMDKSHFLQAMIYAWIYRQHGRKISEIEIVYITRKTKTLPPRIFPFTQAITSEDYDYIEEVITSAMDSLALVKENPELQHLLFRENPTTFY